MSCSGKQSSVIGSTDLNRVICQAVSEKSGPSTLSETPTKMLPLSLFHTHCLLIHFYSFSFVLKMVELLIPPSFEPTDLLKHHHTPKKAAVLGTIHYLQDRHLPVHKLDIYHYFHVPRRTASRWITENEPRRLHNRPDPDPDPRGRLRKLTREDLRKMEDILASGFHGRILN